MFNPNQNAINNAYRKDQELRAAKVRLAQSIEDEEVNALVRYAHNTNVGSTLIFILSILLLAIFFIFSTGSSEAQDMSNNTDPGEGYIDNNAAMLYLREAISKVQAADYESAAFYFDKIIEQYPEFTPAYTGRAYIQFLAGEYELALENAKIALELNPADGAAYYILGEISFAMEAYDNANFYYEAYQLWVESFEGEPILISLMVGENSLDMMNEHWGISIANAELEEMA